MEQSHWIVNYVFPYLNFAIFLAILIFFARKPLAKIAQTRRSDFDEFSKSATQALAQAKQQVEELRKKQENLDSEIKAVKAQARLEAEEEAHRIIEEGRELAKQIVDDAVKMRDVEYQMAQRQLEHEAIQAAKLAIIHKLQNDFNLAQDTAFSERQIKELASLGSQG